MVALINNYNDMENLYKYDLHRYGGGKSHATKFLYWIRKAQSTSNPIIKIISRCMILHYKEKYGLEISYVNKIGAGFYLGHAFNITINPDAVIGKNCNVHKGVVIGQTNRGSKKGVPVIGDEVWIGINAAIVGGITIGNDVLIAPNSFVNCNVPSHSIVFGNPCIIKHRDSATDGYINKKI